MTAEISRTVIEPNFRRHMLALSPEEQERCFKAIEWFENLCDDGERRKRSERVESAVRRRLRVVRAAGDLRLIYAESNAGHNWAWVGRLDDMEVASRRLDASVVEGPINVELRHLLSGPVPPPAPQESPALPQREVDDWLNKIENTTLYVSEAAEILERIKVKYASRARQSGDVLAREQAKTQADVLAMEQAQADVLAGERKFTKLLAEFNAVRAERDRLKDENKTLKKSVDTMRAELSVSRMAGEETKNAKRQAEAVGSELAAMKAAVRKDAIAVMARAMSDERDMQIKDKCSKVCEDFARKLSATGRERDEMQAEDFHKVALWIRALKLT